MKPVQFIFFFVGMINCVFSQDTIQFANKQALAVKVREIGVNEIKFNRFDNLDGPIYIARKVEVKYIRFENGSIDTVKTIRPLLKSREKMTFLNNKIYYSGRSLNDNRLLTLIMKEPASEQKILLNKYANMNSYKTKQKLFFFGGGGAGIIIMGISEIIVSELVESNVPYIIGVAAGAAISATGIVLSVKNRKERLRQKAEIVEYYNNL